MNTTLIVVRHGNTFNAGDVILRVGSATDLPLTEKGILQGEAAGRMIAARGLVPERIFTAPLKRTLRSAEGIAQAFSPKPVIETAEFLTELDYGMDDGKPEEEIVLRLGIVEDPALITPETSLDELKARGKAALKRWDNEAVLPVGWKHLTAYAAALPQKWCGFGAMVAEKFSGKCVVAVTSNGIARFSKALLPAGAAMPENLKLSTGACGIYEFSDGTWHCAAWNLKPEL